MSTQATNYKLLVKRKENRLYQRDVAKKLGINEQTYYKKETGRTEFTIREARMLAKLFDCSLDELFGEELEHAI